MKKQRVNTGMSACSRRKYNSKDKINCNDLIWDERWEWQPSEKVQQETIVAVVWNETIFFKFAPYRIWCVLTHCVCGREKIERSIDRSTYWFMKKIGSNAINDVINAVKLFLSASRIQTFISFRLGLNMLWLVTQKRLVLGFGHNSPKNPPRP